MRRRRLAFSSTVVMLLIGFALPAWSHFGTLIPSDDIISHEEEKTIQVQIKFVHPMEMHYMEMEKPKRFGVMYSSEKTDLLDSLMPVKGGAPDQPREFTFWTIQYTVRRPGDHLFYLESTPYWEASEERFIVHYTKVCVNAFGLEAGWDRPAGLETEIIPLSRPYGLWTGNLFTGQVLLKGKPVPYAQIEVEYLNESPENPSIIKPPAQAYVTQVVKANGEGIFSYAMPRAGWWGFAALNTADWKHKYLNDEKSVEIGAVFWVRTRDMK